MTERKDGGPAYPVPGWQSGESFNGMSLRDAMALSVRMPDDYSINCAVKLTGEDSPADGNDTSGWIDFWMRAEAAYRYRLADAMLAAREGV